MQTSVTFGSTFGEYIEITSQLDPTTQVVISELKNYDPEKFELLIADTKELIFE